MPRSTAVAVPVALLVAACGVAGCGLVDGLLGDDPALDQALATMPADTVSFSFLDREAMAERLGKDDVGQDPTDDELADYRDGLDDDATPGGTSLLTYVAVMADQTTSELEVEWGADGLTEGGAFSVYRFEDDVDLDQVIVDLQDAGFSGTEDDGATTLRGAIPGAEDPNGLAAGAYPPTWAGGVVVVPDDHLVVVGPAAVDVVDVVTGDAESAADADTFADLLAAAPEDVEHAQLNLEPVCGSGVVPEGTAFFVDHDATPSAVLAFADEDAAAADAEERSEQLSEGADVTTGRPLADLGSFDVRADGALVLVDMDLDEPSVGWRSAQVGGGFISCGGP